MNKNFHITSEINPRIKQILKLQQKKSERNLQNLFVVEGIQENKIALENKLEPVSVYINEDLFANSLDLSNYRYITYTLDLKIFEKIAYRKSTGGMIGVYKIPKFDWTKWVAPKNCKMLVIESIEKPGNLGAILRSAEAFGMDSVWIADELIDFYNPNVIRSSVGCVFGVPTYSDTKEKIFDLLKKNDIQVYGTYMNDDSEDLKKIDFLDKSAILFGTEKSGISDFWKDKIKANININTYGKIDSLNLSNAVAVFCFCLK